MRENLITGNGLRSSGECPKTQIVSTTQGKKEMNGQTVLFEDTGFEASSLKDFSIDDKLITSF